MNRPGDAVDIAVPIYNGYEDLVRCVESLKRHTDLLKHRVILIDDCSPDGRVREYIEKLCSAKSVYTEQKAHEPSPEQDGTAPMHIKSEDFEGAGSAGSSPDIQNRPCGFIPVFNTRNQGFSANVNIGLSWSSRDTILLNSDTIVTKNWIEKLQRCAYHSERTATVTPLSNAATLASVPVFLKDNRIPEGYTVDSYADLVERVSLRRYPRVSVGVGYCLYVRQDAYEPAGDFDAKTFQRGYGEENDFCFRCSMLGYTHALCDDTFIYHKGTGSFDTDEKKRLTEEHDRILRKRYPELMKENDAYCRDDPDREIRDNILLHQFLDNGRRNILYFLHLDFREAAKSSIGGTQLHVRDLVRGAVEDFNVFVASRDGDYLRLTVYVKDNSALSDTGLHGIYGEAVDEGGKRISAGDWDLLQIEETASKDARLISMKFPIGKEESWPVFYDEQIEDTLTGILRSFSIDLVHVHHTQGISLDIFRVCRKLEIPVITTLHDYYYACPTTKLLRADGKFCPLHGTFCKPQDRVCMRCLHKTCGYGRIHLIDKWRRGCLSALESSQRIIFPSQSARDIMLMAYPSLEGKSLVIEHGTDHICEKTSSLEETKINASGQNIQPERSPRVHARLDTKPGSDGGFNYISGWAYLDGANSADTSIIMEITGRDGAMHAIKAKKHARPDVAAAAQDQGCLWSGIHEVFDLPDMPDGRYRIRLIVEKDGRYYTDGKSYQGTWKSPAHAGKAPDDGFGGPLHVAFLGGVTPAKGSKVLSEIIHSGDRRFVFYVYGEVGDPEVLQGRIPDNVYFSGVYSRDDISDLLSSSRTDAACILPVWGETFCYTLSEAWERGIPVVGTDIGAVGERIRKAGGGWLVRPDATGEEVLELLAKVRENRAELEEKKILVRGLRLKSVDEMNAEYRQLYERVMSCEGNSQIPEHDERDESISLRSETNLIDAEKVTAHASDQSLRDREFILQGLAAANPHVKGRGAQARINSLHEENEALRTYIDMLQNTTSYRFAKKIADADIPFKEQLKKALKKR